MLVFDVLQMPTASLKLRLQLGATCYLSGRGILLENATHVVIPDTCGVVVISLGRYARPSMVTRPEWHTLTKKDECVGRVLLRLIPHTVVAILSSASDKSDVSQTRLHRPLRILCCTWNMGNEQPPCDLDQWLKIDKE